MGTAATQNRPALELKLDEGFIAAEDNLRLYWRSLVPREPSAVRGHVAIVHGYCEHSGRYRETMERLAAEGWAAHAFDYRGHGQSDGRRAHVDDFGDYLGDLEAFLERVRGQAEGKPVLLLGHSLGGLICARWAVGKSSGVEAIALSSPFVGMAFEPPRPLVAAARLADRFVPWVPMSNGLKIEQLTHDPEILRATEHDPLYQRHTTPRWFREALRAQAELLERAREVRLPLLVMGGGEDPIASPQAIRRFFDQAASEPKAYRLYPGMLHEILNEVDRARVFADLLAWLGERAAAR